MTCKTSEWKAFQVQSRLYEKDLDLATSKWNLTMLRIKNGAGGSGYFSKQELCKTNNNQTSMPFITGNIGCQKITD